MNEMSVNDQYKTICNLVKQKRLKEALTQLESYLYQCNTYDLQTRLEQLQSSYHYMLQYMKDGVKDPDRKKLHEKLLTDTLEIADQVRLSILDESSNQLYHYNRRIHKSDGNQLSIAKAKDIRSEERRVGKEC